MSYLGYTLPNAVFQGVRATSFSGNGSNRVFTLPAPASSTTAIEVLVNNVQQSPYDGSYTVSGSTLTFDEAPSSGTNNIYVVYRDQTFMSTVPGDGTVTPAKLSGGAPNWDSSGNVGIGTSSPNINTNGTVLHINNSATSRAAMLHMTNGNSGSAANDGLIVGKWSDNDNYFWDYEAQALVFGTNSTERMRIDASGRVTMPFQPLFVATASSTNWGWSNNKITAFDQIPYGQNTGSHYNTSTQRFTAPVTGNYLFNLKITLNTNFGNFQIRVHKNGNWHQTLVGQASGSANDQRSGTALVQLNANDYVELFGTGSHAGMLSGVGSCEFSGQLIG